MSNRQLALPGVATTHNTNAKVPMFLQKLYKIVDDPSTNDVICWADTGDSFFVLDHELLAKEHLGNWFKHNKFQSFVRQLNMYGFHKIPHLQQGVLRSDNNTELWQFAHENFHRGQEDRLIYIERKKQQQGNQREQQQQQQQPPPPAIQQQQQQQPPQQGQLPPAGQQAQLPYVPSSPSQLSQAGPNPPLDMQNIVSGLAAIRRHQTNITTELEEIKRSNQNLWRESIEARARHTKQQDTINRIVKFLAGVFGQQYASPVPKEGEINGAHGPSPPLPVGRLMIEDGKRTSSTKVRVTEIPDDDASSPQPRFQTADTPATNPPSPQPALSETASAPSAPSSPIIHSKPPATTTQKQQNPSSSDVHNIISTQPRYPASNPSSTSASGSGKGNDESSTQNDGQLRRSPSMSPNYEAKIQAALSQMPITDLQQMFASLTTPPNYPDAWLPGSINMDTSGDRSNTSNAGQVLPYQAGGFDWSSFPPPANMFEGAPVLDAGTSNFTGGFPGEGILSFDNNVNGNISGGSSANDSQHQGPPPTSPGALYRHNQGLANAWQATEDIDREVSSVNSGITSLIETLGLDPAMLDSSNIMMDPQIVAGRKAASSSAMDGIQSSGSVPRIEDHQQPPTPVGGGREFFDAFLNDLNAPSSGGRNNDNPFEISSFLDQVPTPTVTTANGRECLGGGAQSKASTPISMDSPPNPSSNPGLEHEGSADVSMTSGTFKGRKRKSDVVMMDSIPDTPSSPAAANTRSKKRRDR